MQPKRRGRPPKDAAFTKKAAATTPKCQHCDNPGTRPRGLCVRCYNNPRIRQQYPSTSKFSRRMDHEPTAEEVERMVAEQMENLPDWWPAPGEVDLDPIPRTRKAKA